MPPLPAFPLVAGLLALGCGGDRDLGQPAPPPTVPPELIHALHSPVEEAGAVEGAAVEGAAPEGAAVEGAAVEGAAVEGAAPAAPAPGAPPPASSTD